MPYHSASEVPDWVHELGAKAMRQYMDVFNSVYEKTGDEGHAAAAATSAVKARGKAYNPDEPRVPSGDSAGGQWTSGGGSAPGGGEKDGRLSRKGHNALDDADRTTSHVAALIRRHERDLTRDEHKQLEDQIRSGLDEITPVLESLDTHPDAHVRDEAKEHVAVLRNMTLTHSPSIYNDEATRTLQGVRGFLHEVIYPRRASKKSDEPLDIMKSGGSMDFTRYVEISKIDPEQCMVEGYASTPQLDSQGERVTIKAIEDALPDYMKYGNIREMHNRSAVGKTKSATVDDVGLYIRAKVVDKAAWEKIKEGVYSGFSIGGNVKTRQDEVITGLNLVEISLVDRPANPGAVVTMWKSADGQGQNENEEEAPNKEEVNKEAEPTDQEKWDALHKVEVVIPIVITR